METNLGNLIKQTKQEVTRGNPTLRNTCLNLHCKVHEWFLYGWKIGLKCVRQRAQLSTWKEVHAPTISINLANKLVVATR